MKQNTFISTHQKKGRKPMVSVLLPVYNAVQYVEDAVTSIQRQTVKSIEVLIIDDHSTDGSWELLKKIQKTDPRIILFRNKKNLGLVKSLNTIIPHARGHYIARMDADDISLPHRFEKQIDYLKKHKKIVACGGQEHIIDEAGIQIAEKRFPTDPASCRKLITNFMVIQPPVLMARGEIMRTLRYDNHLFKNDDISMHFKLLQYGEFGNVPETIFYYRRLPTSLTHRDPKRVYFLALLVRLNAMRYYGFRPTILNGLALIPESILVLLLPNNFIIDLFEWLRYVHKSAKELVASSLGSVRM